MMGIQQRSESRGGTAVRVLAIHTTEGYGTARQLVEADWWEGSSHVVIDEKEIVPGVSYDRAAWTLRSGNRWSENAELIGFAARSRQNWLEDHAHQLELTAQWLAARAKARGIPLVKLTPEQYRAGGTGVIGHHDHTIGYRDGTHTDPGAGFPFDTVLARAKAILAPPTPPKPKPVEDPLVALSDAEAKRLLANTDQLVTIFRAADAKLPDGRAYAAIITARDAAVAAAKGNPKALADALRPYLIEAVKAGQAAGAGATPASVVDELAARLAAKG